MEKLIAGHLSYYGDRGSRIVKAYFDTGPEGSELEGLFSQGTLSRMGLAAHRGWARLMLDRRGLSQHPRTPQGTKTNTPVLITATTKRPFTIVM